METRCVFFEVRLNSNINVSFLLQSVKSILQNLAQIEGNIQNCVTQMCLYRDNAVVLTTEVLFPAGQGFIFITVFRPTLRPTQPPSQWVPGSLSQVLRHSPASASMNDWSFLSTSRYIVMSWCLNITLHSSYVTRIFITGLTRSPRVLSQFNPIRMITYQFNKIRFIIILFSSRSLCWSLSELHGQVISDSASYSRYCGFNSKLREADRDFL